MSLSPALVTPLLTHVGIAAFADERVNLKREDATEYRDQVRRLRQKLERYAADHPDYGIYKTLLSGSLAKGTALNPQRHRSRPLPEGREGAQQEDGSARWLAKRLREAYPQMKADQIKPNTHSVCIQFAVSGLNVDVLPSRPHDDFAVQGGSARHFDLPPREDPPSGLLSEARG